MTGGCFQHDGRANTFFLSSRLCVRLYWRRVSTGHDREMATTGWRAPLPPAGGESRRDFRGSGRHLLRAFAALRDKNSVLTLTLKAHLVIDARDIAVPFAVIFLQQYFRDGFAASDDFAQRVEIAGFIVTAGVQAIARCQAR